MTKILSVVIASYNTKDLTLAAVNSILNQPPKFGFEVIVVDDASTDGSVEALKKLKVKVLVNKTNLGYVATNNKGIKAAKGRFILLLNSDTEVKRGALEALIKFAETNKDMGVVGAKLLNPDGSLQPSCYRLPTLKNAFLAFWLNQKWLFEKYAPTGRRPVEVEAVMGAAFLITPQALKKVGMLNSIYRSYFEDMDYCRLARKKGLKVYYLPSAEVVHYHGASFAKLADAENQWRKLIPSSKIYHGPIKHYLINAIIWSGQKWQKLLKILS